MEGTAKNPGTCEGCAHKISSEYEDIPADPECEAGHDYELQNDLGCRDYKG